MQNLRSLLCLAIAAPFALAACSTAPTTTTSDYSAVSTKVSQASTTADQASAKADQALAKAQQALDAAQQAEADAKASNQQVSQAYQRSLTK